MNVIDLLYEWRGMYRRISLDNEGSFPQKIANSKILVLNYKHLTYFHIQIYPIHKNNEVQFNTIHVSIDQMPIWHTY